MTDRTGAPLHGATIVALARRPVAKGSDFRIVFQEIGGGRYRARTGFPLAGQWELRYRVEQRGRLFEARQRIEVK